MCDQISTIRGHIEDAKAFYSGPWLDGIVERYGMNPQIEFYELFAVTDNYSRKLLPQNSSWRPLVDRTRARFRVKDPARCARISSDISISFSHCSL